MGCSSSDNKYSIGGNAEGLSGSVTLSAGSEQITLTANGAFTFPGSFDPDSDVALAVTAQPVGQTCSITPASVHVAEDVTNVLVSCVNVGSVSGTVLNYFTGTPIEGAKVSVKVTRGTTAQTVGTAVTDASGAYLVSAIGLSDRFTVAAEAASFGSDATTFANTAAEPEQTVGALQLLSAQLDTPINTSAATSLSVDGQVLVQLPANSLVRAGGGAISGEVRATVTVIDPSSDPNVMPGELVTRDPATGAALPIQSFGALDVRFADATGAPLNLAPGQSATLHIPLAAGAGSPPATIPLFYFNESTGFWVQEGTATLTTNGSGQQEYVGTVVHFTTWNADQVYNTIQIKGCVVDETGARVSGARVTALGATYIGSASALTNVTGDFSVSARIGSQVLVSASSGGLSRTVTVTTEQIDKTIDSCFALQPAAATIKLTWGENPSDLDSHFLGPDGGTGQFHVYYASPAATVGSQVYNLDVDDTSGFGPEIITASGFIPGTYRYVVHHYGGSSNIKASPARVELNLRGAITVYSPSQATGVITADWHVFNLIVDAAGGVTVQPVQKFISSVEASSASAATTTVQARALRQPSNLVERSIANKYYAD